jgi:hypothetical protein
MKIYSNILTLFVASLVFANVIAKSPNVIIIYSDDHGYTDLGAYGIDPNVGVANRVNGQLSSYGGGEQVAGVNH